MPLKTRNMSRLSSMAELTPNTALLLFTMCHHIHYNHFAFVESVKDEIRQSTLAEHKDDMSTYLNRFLQNNLRLISSTGLAENDHFDLIPHIMCQLHCTKIPLFQQAALKWHREYMERTLKITPTQIVEKADEESQILRHTNQCVETIDPPSPLSRPSSTPRKLLCQAT
jgi:hypothetical protein